MVEEETEEEKEVEEVGGHEEATDEGVEVAMEDCFRMEGSERDDDSECVRGAVILSGVNNWEPKSSLQDKEGTAALVGLTSFKHSAVLAFMFCLSSLKH